MIFVFDILWFLLIIAGVCLLLAAADALLIGFLHVRRRRRLKRYRYLLCACGSWPVATRCRFDDGRTIHEPARCFPAVES